MFISHYTDCTEKMLWECAKGHQWMQSVNQVITGRQSWCSKCKKSSKRIYYTIFSKNMQKIMEENVYQKNITEEEHA